MKVYAYLCFNKSNKIMKTITIKGIQYSGIQPEGMSDKQFESMVVRNNMTAEKMAKLIGGLK
jgi:hypothetical protein